MLETFYSSLENGLLKNSELIRCAWCLKDELYQNYHDQEWGAPLKDRRKLFEMIILESMQAGLSWHIILKRREAMREAFHHFSPEALAALGDEELNAFLGNEALIRNRRKIFSVRQNAQAFLSIDEKQSVVDYLWQFTQGQVIVNKWRDLSEIPTESSQSRAMAKQLRQDGFVFLGPISCYAFMQSVGMVNDHLRSCYRYNELIAQAAT
ncbi:3-methyladenine DNA glycosylase [Legionella birminghamensis]|uniref:3-methyladenine DNA glycosylase n=1 Tax=Legionella birminghamensis TaxID=28083 RepID=A0A378I606_9GAMM|nr:DNA-3-methyladenine glycosylase I [Legionella birminghamensis]KTC68722.1 3-methyladenine DNA glycosylase [Legionella birminghamensis]STX30292.1 3-methyladenine DNA glycosylase [Legionella birminghamensis]